MTTLDIPDTRTVVGEFSFAIVIKEDGDVGIELGWEDLELEQLIGYLTTILDLLREEVRISWDMGPGWSADEEDEEDIE